MLALESLVSGTKLNKVLNGALLPENNNPAFLQVADVHSTTVLFANKESPVQVGFGIALRCSPNQLYCPLISVAKELECGYLNVERMNKCVNGNLGDDVQKRHTFLKIKEIHEELPDCSGLPQYFTAFAEPLGLPLLQTIVDQLAVDCFGSTANLELTRNLTVDLYDADSGVKECSDELWRDFAGFLVTDRFRYCELDIKCASLLSALAHDKAAALPPTVCIKQLSSATRPLFHDYEQNVSMVVDRTEYLDFVLALNGISGVVAVDETRQPIGYALAIPGRLLQCYADSERVASALLCALFGSSSPGSTVSLYLRLGADHSLDSKLLPVADHVRRVRRFHTRIVPTSINWTNVFAPNIGVHLF